MTVGLYFPIYVIAMLSFFGWMMLCFFLPTGMWALFFDAVAIFWNRPRIMDKNEFDGEKEGLAKEVQ